MNMRSRKKIRRTKTEERIARAREVLICYRFEHPDYRGTQEPDEAALIDLFADLMHLAKEMGQNPANLVRTASNHYEEESVNHA
jgi:hypothetical protein